MENPKTSYSNHPMSQSSSRPPNYGVDGVCMISSAWSDKQHSSFMNFISSFLSENSIRLNYVSISPDIIFNCAGISLAFVFVTQWVCENLAIFSRIQKLKEKFASLYVVVTLSTKEQNDSFVRSYFKYGMEFGNPTFVPVLDPEMGFESIVKIAHSRGVCKRQDAKAKMEAERKRSMQDFDVFLRVVTSIPGINDHDAIAIALAAKAVNLVMGKILATYDYYPVFLDRLNQAIGSIEAIAKAPKEYIIQNTDLSAEKAEIITRFFRDPKFYMSPKVNW